MSEISMERVNRCTDVMMEAICTAQLPATREVEEGVALMMVASFILVRALVDGTDDGRTTADLVNSCLAQYGVDWRIYPKRGGSQ
jgi:hypothetical protein